MRTLLIASDGETLRADLYGDLPAWRAAILVHGQSWDGSGWRDVALQFAARAVPALALNLRGYDGSSGKTNATITVFPVPLASPAKRTATRSATDGVAYLDLYGQRDRAGHGVIDRRVLASQFDDLT